jgi:hypothetical protein
MENSDFCRRKPMPTMLRVASELTALFFLLSFSLFVILRFVEFVNLVVARRLTHHND